MIAVGQVYTTKIGEALRSGGPKYQILAIWDDFAWVYIYYPGVGSGGQPKEPKTMGLDFFDQDGMELVYALPERLL
jgi:hypothetical protein